MDLDCLSIVHKNLSFADLLILVVKRFFSLMESYLLFFLSGLCFGTIFKIIRSMWRTCVHTYDYIPFFLPIWVNLHFRCKKILISFLFQVGKICCLGTIFSLPPVLSTQSTIPRLLLSSKGCYLWFPKILLLELVQELRALSQMFYWQLLMYLMRII